VFYLSLIIFVIGTFLGSFLNVVSDRILKKESFLKGRSCCEHCKHSLSPLDLVPIFSFVALSGRCRYCKKPINAWYPISEVFTGLIYFLTFQFLILNAVPLLSIEFLYYFITISMLIIIFFTDAKYRIIPNKILYPATCLSLLFLSLFQRGLIVNSLLSAFGSFIFFLLISFVFYLLTKKQSMGGGDLKLAFFLGLFLGFPNIIFALYLAFLTGALYSIILIIWKKKSFLKDTVALGPFLVLGSLISLFYGNLIRIYLFVHFNL
jgi:leader peptidase (prepilin peptidase)/N-methyltransferase